MLAVFSKGIVRIPYLAVFLMSSFVYCPSSRQLRQDCTGVIGWGTRPNTQRPRRLAQQHQLPFIALEDGFIRSYGTGRDFPPLSMIYDDLGIYYDASRPSRLEQQLNSPHDLLKNRQTEVIKAKALINEHHLSKYNHAPTIAIPYATDQRDKILLVDQTVGDMSVKKGGADKTTFLLMLASARQDNPDALIYIKTHPEVTSGHKHGYLYHIENDDKTVIIREHCNPIALIKTMNRVYVVTSTLGFEALLLDKPVTVFGLPWYAGWGVTDDRQPLPRRERTRSINELFAAAYFDYSRYLNPFSHQSGDIFDVLNWLILQKNNAAQQTSRLIGIGFRRWKAIHLLPLLSLDKKQILFVKNRQKLERLTLTSADTLFFWGNTPPFEINDLITKYQLKSIRIEDGFIRSVGLGSDLIKPLSIVLDDVGLYFDATQPSRLEILLNQHIFSDEDRNRARHIRQYITDHGITKYNIEPLCTPDWVVPKSKKILLVIGQVENDASIKFGTTKLKSNLGLLQRVRDNNPEAYIVFKPHPDIMAGNRKGKIARATLLQWADTIETTSSVVSCIDHCDEVHTLTSLSGFDALLRQKTVYAYGRPFYAGWGLLANDSMMVNRQRQLSLDELVAGVLIYYPRYWDHQLQGITTCEAVLTRIVATKAQYRSRKTGIYKYLSRQLYRLSIIIKSLYN